MKFTEASAYSLQPSVPFNIHRRSSRFNKYERKEKLPSNWLEIARNEGKILAEDPPYVPKTSKIPKWVKGIVSFFTKHPVR